MPRRQLSTALAGLGSAAPPYVSTMGGAFTLIDSGGNEKPIQTRHFDCVMIDMQIPGEGGPKVERVFWGLDEKGQPKGFDQGTHLPPECFSDNGIGASAAATNPQSANCQACPMNRFDWVSKRDATKRTKACSVTKKIAVLPMEEVETGQWEPIHEAAFVLRVPVMSHKNLADYGLRFKGQSFDLTQVVTRISFVHGEVGLLQFDGVAKIDDETDKLIDSILESKVTDGLVGRGDVPWQGALPAPNNSAAGATAAIAAPQPVQIAPHPKPEPAPATVLPAAEPTKPKRTRKAAEAAPAGVFTPPTVQAAPAVDDSIPPFLRREQQTGIQSNAPPPPADLEAQLQSIFNLKT